MGWPVCHIVVQPSSTIRHRYFSTECTKTRRSLGVARIFGYFRLQSPVPSHPVPFVFSRRSLVWLSEGCFIFASESREFKTGIFPFVLPDIIKDRNARKSKARITFIADAMIPANLFSRYIRRRTKSKQSRSRH